MPSFGWMRGVLDRGPKQTIPIADRPRFKLSTWGRHLWHKNPVTFLVHAPEEGRQILTFSWSKTDARTRHSRGNYAP
eukprot:6221338-Pyramimonas_sp.AAC.1